MEKKIINVNLNVLTIKMFILFKYILMVLNIL